MKKSIINKIIWMIGLGLCSMACEEDSSPSPSTTTTTDTDTTITTISDESLGMTVNGATWAGVDVGAYAVTIVGYTAITVSADHATSDVESVTISLEGDTEPGTYTLSVISTAPTMFLTLKNDESLTFISGQIIVTKHDTTNKKVEGTFSYKGKDESDKVYTITNGSFSAEY